jgi:hypothetical protein
VVTKIKKVKHCDRAVLYNENKVLDGTAKCIHAGNFLQDVEALSVPGKLQRFENLLALNRRAIRRALHIVVSFAPGEILSRDRMIEIACEFMDRIGYGAQPYLVYQHFDTAIAHLHIVSTPIQPDGTSLNKSLLFKYKSEPARKALEEKYGLVRAQRQRGAQLIRSQALPVERLQYGSRPAVRAITNILEYVLEEFHYRSLSDLNAILRWYNLRADPGKPGTRMHGLGGLIYYALDEKGQRVGTPVKAGSIYFKPGLKWLNTKFKANAEIDPAAIWHVRSVVDAAVRRKPGNWPAFVDALRVDRMAVSPCFGAEKFPDDLSFVDWEGKIVINAGELGKDYSAKEIWQRLGLDPQLQPILLLLAEVAARTNRKLPLSPSSGPNVLQPTQSRHEAIDILFRQEEQAQQMPYELSRKANQKKKSKSQKL